MRYSIGLDIGIASVGYAILALDSNDTPYRIERLGVRAFEKAEHPKDGSSLAKPRREARSARRRLRRHRHRLERIRGLIVSSGILTKENLENLFYGQLTDIYELRTKALDEAVSSDEFARIMINLAQRRGYKSNKKSESNSNEDGRILSAVSDNLILCEQKGYRTIGEMFFRDEKFSKYKRNKGDDYNNTVDRASVEYEAKMIFAAQREKGASFATKEIEKTYLDILLGQRSFAEGPASGPYSGNQSEKMRGLCTFEKGEKRAAKATYSFQLFNLCQRINHIRIICDGEKIALDDEQRQIILDLAHQKAELDYVQVRKALDLPDEIDFVGIRYEERKRNDAEKKTRIKDLEVYHKIRKCVEKVSKEAFARLDYDMLDAIGEALSNNYSDEIIKEKLISASIPEDVAETLLELPNIPNVGHLSVVACRKLIPFLMQGMTYDKACEAAGYSKVENKAQFYLPPLSAKDDDITNPVVRRAISQTIKVVNAIVREMDESPVYVNIELARELSYDLNERRKIEKEQDKNAAENEKALNELREYTNNPSGHDIVKYKLWKEQGGRCPYSGEAIEISRLFEPGYVDVDHIVPYSICFDDRMANKVLVLAKENRQKGNKLPLQYLQGEKRDRFIILVSQSHLKAAKKARLLKEKITDEAEWKQRSIQDTQYISSFMNRYIAENLLFAPSAVGRKRHVTSVNGAITSYVRKRWGIKKVRENGDLHHAVDAVVIGCITQAMVNRISKYTYYKETQDDGDYFVDEQTGELLSRFPTPWPHFIDELTIRLCQNTAKMQKMLNDVNFKSYLEVDIDRLESPFVSRMPNRKVTGAAHQDTIRSGKCIESKMTVSKVSLSSLKLDNDGEIAGYYNKESDILLYNALKKRLAAFGGNGKLAFAETEFRKPKSNGTPGPVVKKVKICEPSSSFVSVLSGNGIAKNEAMVRCDVFYVEDDGYYFVPVYVSDTVKPELPLLAPTQKKDKNGNKIQKQVETEDFLFSLYKNDLIRVTSKRGISLNKKNKKSDLPDKKTFDGEEGVLLYFSGFDVSSAVIGAVSHDASYEHRSIGKTMKSIEKYEVDILGRVKKVGKEKRMSFEKMKRQ